MFVYTLFLPTYPQISRPKGRHSDLSYPNTSLVWKRCSPCGTITSNPNSTNNLAPSAGHHIMSVPRQKLFFEPANIRIISHSTKHLRFFSSEARLEKFIKLGNLVNSIPLSLSSLISLISLLPATKNKARKPEPYLLIISDLK